MNSNPLKNVSDKILLVMDLDSTLIYASETEIHKQFDYKVFHFFCIFKTLFSGISEVRLRILCIGDLVGRF